MASSDVGDDSLLAKGSRLGRAARKRAKQKEQRGKRAERNVAYKQVERARTPEQDESVENEPAAKRTTVARNDGSQTTRHKYTKATAGRAVEEAGWESPVDEWGDNDEPEPDVWHAEGDTWDGTWRAAGGASWGDSGVGYSGGAKQQVRDEMARVKELTQMLSAFTQKKQLAEAVAIFEQNARRTVASTGFCHVHADGPAFEPGPPAAAIEGAAGADEGRADRAVSLMQKCDRDTAVELGLAQAAALLGKWKVARGSLERAAEALAKGAALGSGQSTGAVQVEEERDLYKGLRRQEMQLEHDRLQRFVKNKEALDLRKHLSRTFVFSSRLCVGGDAAVPSADTLAQRLVAMLEDTFGLDECYGRGLDEPEGALKRIRRRLSKKAKLRWDRIFGVQPRRDTGEGDGEDAEGSEGRLPVKLEICSGNGDWVVAQALEESGKALWGSLELRHDRVYSVFARMALNNVSNLCIIGGDAAQVMRQHVKAGSVANICINFPEPPHHSGNASAENKLHLLTAEFFLHAVWPALVPPRGGGTLGGKLTIFSDNYEYCGTLARTLAALHGVRGEPVFQSVRGAECSSAGDGSATFEDVDGVRLYHGIPGSDSGHAVHAASYFDRFWERGQHTGRYFLVLAKVC
ncbi:hypothetical protein CYMTET_43184 [Cymbomonas tetramitiformis]|uniref:tRNA (guanine(46)-N(7))-methyltransferase n=1 Tax=Cymbomonas tetramitiformis TaxID=36881 RepID=A0AAE0F0W3_9CHLO|nr:hypothetical protein CYMTET_43184 [Cymbomonas tetramitiformis]